ncbi:TAXI family TRAP transporter solute-binding subunit [Oceanobacillus jeddahense]|uniref:TAXI family TRAP transporter solute-binding subunit n=1 Tax=Oceanobacillus jeddahense TaxID=1462527 RepID=A0ABY5JQ44_9BACI|nr:TAXI family TRAP transporter solute-binding subunit [Oceanobacillus jeddahense]UUI02443.1 TAXI family TRAP transporter solute-binding subunit [Oceanobacillus jeddahense]
MKKYVSILLILLFTVITLVACSDSESSAEGEVDESGVTQMKIATATTSGAYYPIGGVMASILSREMDGYNFTAEATGGSQENARLLDSGQIQFGFFGADSFYAAANGLSHFEGNEIEDLRTLARIYGNHVHIVTLEGTGIETVEDLEGKRVAIGAPGSGTANKAEEVLTAHGFDLEKDINAQYLDFAEGSDGLADGIVDAVIISVGIPSGNVQELVATHHMKLVKFSEEGTQAVLDQYPYYSEGVIPQDAYDGMEEDVPTVIAANEIGVSAKLDEDFVYEVTKLLFEDHLDEFKASHNAMEELELEILPDSPVPYHPGAEKFFKEQGLIE